MPYKNILGHMAESELKVIESWAMAAPKNSTIVEVGSFFGRSAVCWALSADKSVKIYCIDMWPESVFFDFKFGLPYTPESGKEFNIWNDFNENIKGLQNIVPIRGHAPVDINYPGDPIDIFFLDAGHSNPNDWEIIEYFMQFMKPNSMICGHDYDESWPDVIENAHRLEHILNSKLQRHSGSLWSIHKSDALNIAYNKIEYSKANGGILILKNPP